MLYPMKGCPVIEINHSKKLPEKFKLSNFSLLERKRYQYALPRSSWVKNTKFNYPCVPVLSSNCDKLKDILVKSCTLQKAKLTSTCIKFFAGRRTYGLLHELSTLFICIHRWFNAGVKSLLPWGSPWGGRGGCFGACHKSRLNCMLFVVCAMWSVNDIKREVYKS